jgi:hypothetical protein
LFSSNNNETGLGVNEIWRRLVIEKTGNRDKKSIIDSIKLLEKAGLLNTKKHQNISRLG